MARIVGGSILGFLSGKMAGMVFSHNRVGQYIRQYVIPTDPATVAQIQARSKFGNQASNWHSLTDTAKSLWNNFALTLFNPKNGSNTGQFSGINAFVASNNVVDNFNAMLAPDTQYDVLLNAVSLGSPTIEPFVYVETPATNPFPAVIGDDYAGGPSNMVLVESLAEVTPEGNWSLQVQLTEEQTDLESFPNTFGENMGFVCYRSEGLNQANQFVANPFLQMLPAIPAATYGTPGTGSLIRFRVTDDLVDGNYKTYPSIGQFCQLSLYAVSKYGQLTKIGAVKCQVVTAISA